MHSAIFLDRDGVIIENRPQYVRTWQDVTILPGSLQALAVASASPYKLVIITNQAGIAKGLIDPTVAQEINQRLIVEIERAGGRIDGLFVCPHQPEDGCDCRKPRPGLLFQARQALELDLGRSILIGDNLTDIQAGQAAGVGCIALVRTGLGARFSGELSRPELSQVRIFANLAEALAELVS
jgi:D-glycero-D-manno-heptose 1,7-bisphosphate phosphatase